MYPFTDKKSTTKKTKWTNTCQYIVIHHTAWGSYQSNLRYLSEWTAQASVHFVIWPNEEVAKIGDPRDILRHAGNSERGNLTNMNRYSLGIEVVWFGEYNIKQLIRLTDLVEYLMGVYNIPRENVIRHADITQYWNYSKNKTLRDWKRRSRKTDIAPNFFWTDFQTRRNQLTPRTSSRYI